MWVEKTTGKLVQESPQDLEIIEVQVPKLVQFPGTADRLALGLSKPDEVFNFWLTGLLTASPKRKGISTSGWPACYTSATLRATAASLDLRTQQLAVQENRRVGGGLLSQCTPLKRPQAIYRQQLRGQLLL